MELKWICSHYDRLQPAIKNNDAMKQEYPT